MAVQFHCQKCIVSFEACPSYLPEYGANCNSTEFSFSSDCWWSSGVGLCRLPHPSARLSHEEEGRRQLRPGKEAHLQEGSHHRGLRIKPTFAGLRASRKQTSCLLTVQPGSPKGRNHHKQKTASLVH